jgi:DNA-binding MarR family transcriptional regulator
LRLSERLLVHLYWFRYNEVSGLGRMEATQQGMIHALGISQNTASKILTRLVAGGAIRTETLHVPGASRRVKVYALTPAGDSLARQLGAPRWRPDSTFQRVERYSDPGT